MHPVKFTEDISITLLPDPKHEFLVTTREVAIGFGVHIDTLRSHKHQNKSELKEGVHFISNVQILHAAPNGGSSRTTMWTKRGIIRMSNFIKSGRAKIFRDWTEDIVLNHIEKKLPSLPLEKKRNHNRLTEQRIVDILSIIAEIEDRTLRLRLRDAILHQ